MTYTNDLSRKNCLKVRKKSTQKEKKEERKVPRDARIWPISSFVLNPTAHLFLMGLVWESHPHKETYFFVSSQVFFHILQMFQPAFGDWGMEVEPDWQWFICFFFWKISLREYSLITNKHNQELINILENQKIYGGFLIILIFQVSLSRTHLKSKTFLFTRL